MGSSAAAGDRVCRRSTHFQVAAPSTEHVADGGIGPSGRMSSYGRNVEGRPLRAAVAILETHDVVELGGARLEDDRVLQGGHPVPSARPEVDRFAGKQLERLQRGVGIPTSKSRRPDWTATVSSFCS